MARNEEPEAEREYWTHVVPEHIEATQVNNLISTLADQIYDGPFINDALLACGIEPTSRACWLAAAAAVHVLLAEEVGQQVAEARFERVRDEAEAPKA